jgi:hypothetical protein
MGLAKGTAASVMVEIPRRGRRTRGRSAVIGMGRTSVIHHVAIRSPTPATRHWSGSIPPRWRSSSTTGGSPTSTPRRARPLLCPGLQRGPGPPLPAGDLAAAGHRDGGGGAGGAGGGAGPGGPALPFRGDMEAEMRHYHPRGDQIIPAFVAGINAYVDPGPGGSRTPSPGVRALGMEPEHWTPEVVVSRHQGLLGNAGAQLNRGRAVHLLGRRGPPAPALPPPPEPRRRSIWTRLSMVTISWSTTSSGSINSTGAPSASSPRT